MDPGPSYSGHLSCVAESKPKEQPLLQKRGEVGGLGGWKTKLQEAHR